MRQTLVHSTQKTGRMRRWRHTRAGSVLLSVDFLIALPISLGVGAVTWLLDPVVVEVPTVLIAYMGAMVALTALVLGAHTLLTSLLTDDYLVVLERAPGGVKGLSRPYKLVATVCACGALVSVVSVLTWPVVVEISSVLRGIVFGVCTFLTAWGLLGSVQLVGLGAFHLERRIDIMQIVRDFRSRDERRRKSG